MSDALTRTLHLRWSKNGHKGGAWISAGTYGFLGLTETASELATTTYNVPTKTISRRRYPGGPVVTYQRDAGTITRVLGGLPSTAKSSRVVVLKTGTQQETVRFTGPTHAFVAWLIEHANPSNTIVTIEGFNGNPYGVINKEGALAPAAN